VTILPTEVYEISNAEPLLISLREALAQLYVILLCMAGMSHSFGEEPPSS